MIPEMSTALRSSRAFAYENPRPDVQALVPAGARRILDLGCSSGAVGAALKGRQGAEVVGIELDAGYAADAAPRLDRVVQGDLEELAARDDLAADLGRFDCLVAADVLEHLRDPWTVLARFAELLEPGATAVVSLPNVRYWEMFWQVGARGTWPLRSQGTFDRSHLRWFTLFDAHGLCEHAGLEVEAVARVMRLRPRGSRVDRWLPAVPPLRTFLTFQHVLRARTRR
jgi:methionine biosynthesis protein MetW